MKFDVVTPRLIHLPEPALSFGFGQSTDHPKDGLYLYGPHKADDRNKVITIGVIGTTEGLEYFRRWGRSVLGGVCLSCPGRPPKILVTVSRSARPSAHLPARTKINVAEADVIYILYVHIHCTCAHLGSW